MIPHISTSKQSRLKRSSNKLLSVSTPLVQRSFPSATFTIYLNLLIDRPRAPVVRTDTLFLRQGILSAVVESKRERERLFMGSNWNRAFCNTRDKVNSIWIEER